MTVDELRCLSTDVVTSVIGRQTCSSSKNENVDEPFIYSLMKFRSSI